MEFSFNLIDEPWIPCVLNDGTYAELGLRDTLVRAPEIREIADPSPLVTVALHRLLLAILHRNFGPSTDDAWGTLWSAGAFDATRLYAYFAEWRSCFDLFDDGRPFYQTTEIRFDYERSVASMVFGLTLGNYITLFDHTLDASPPELTPAQAAREVVTQQAFALGGLIGFQSKHGESASPHKYTTQALLAKGAVTLVRGDTLFQTLVLNLLRYDDAHPFQLNDPANDLPAWEQAQPAQSASRRPLGYLDVLTWQSRRIRLRPEPGLDGGPIVRNAVVMRGYQLGNGVLLREYETMVAFRALEKPPKDQDPYVQISLQPDRALWRDSTALFQSVAGGGLLRPRNLGYVANLAGSELDDDDVFAADILGISIDRSVVYFWRHERLPLPVRLLRDPTLAGRIGDALRTAENVARLFRAGFSEFPGEGKPRKMPHPLQLFAEAMLSAPGGIEPDPARVRALADSLAPAQVYWSRLENDFKQYVEMLGLGHDRELEARTLWRNAVRDAAYDAFNGMVDSFDTDARALRAAVTAERAFGMQLALILNEFLPRSAVEEETVAQTA